MKADHPLISIEPATVPAGDVLVYEYGCRLDKVSAQHADEQIRQARDLYNAMIELMQRVHAEMSAWTLERAGTRAQELDAAAQAATTAFNAARAQGDQQAMDRIATERRALWRELAESLKATRKQHAAELRERFYRRIGKNSRCETYQLRSTAIERGLGWATANAALDSALRAWAATIAHGQAPRFLRSDTDEQDALVRQLAVRGGGGLPMPRLFDGSWPEIWLHRPAEVGPRRYGEFRFRLGMVEADQYATGTWQYHRPLPDDAHATSVRLVRRRVADKVRWALQVVVRMKEPLRLATAPTARLAVLHFGWAPDDGRGMAAVADSADPTRARSVRLPPDIEADLQRSSRLQSGRERSRAELIRRLAQLPAGDCSRSAAAEIEALASLTPRYVPVRRLRALQQLLAADGHCPEWLRDWLAEDRKTWRASVLLARRARHRRRDFYRRAALDLCRNYSALVIRPLELKEAAARIDARTGLRNPLSAEERTARMAAALYELEEAIRWASAKHGTALFERVAPVECCAHCGAPVPESGTPGRPTPCGHCGGVVDDLLAGAARTWQQAIDGIETKIVDFHATTRQARLEQAQQRKARLAGMAQNRLPRRPRGAGNPVDL